MNQLNSFTMEFLAQETHFVLPTITSIVLVQNLYDALFQYALTKEKEEKLEAFIKKLEAHIKKKSRSPFSIPVDEMDFLEEGLEELRLLNWMQIPALKFAIHFTNADMTGEQEKEAMQNIIEDFEDYMIVSLVEGRSAICVYPYRITPY